MENDNNKELDMGMVWHGMVKFKSMSSSSYFLKISDDWMCGTYEASAAALFSAIDE